MNKELIYAALSLLFIASIAYGSYTWGQRNQGSKQVEEAQVLIEQKVKEVDNAYLLAIEQKDKAIHSRELQIVKLKKDYQDLMLRIRAKAGQADSVNEPQTDMEIRQRLEALGHKPR